MKSTKNWKGKKKPVYKSKKSVILAVRVPVGTMAALRRTADKNDTTLSAIVVHSIEAFLDENAPGWRLPPAPVVAVPDLFD